MKYLVFSRDHITNKSKDSRFVGVVSGEPKMDELLQFDPVGDCVQRYCTNMRLSGDMHHNPSRQSRGVVNHYHPLAGRGLLVSTAANEQFILDPIKE